MLLCVSDIETEINKNDEVSNVTVIPGQPLLLRCRAEEDRPKWEKDSKMMDAPTLALSPSAKGEVLRQLRVSLKFHISKFELYPYTNLSCFSPRYALKKTHMTPA